MQSLLEPACIGSRCCSNVTSLLCYRGLQLRSRSKFQHIWRERRLCSNRQVSRIALSSSRDQQPSQQLEDLDSVVLDDAYYKEMGMNQQDVEDQQALAANDIDPDADNYNLEDLFTPREGTPKEIVDAYFNQAVYGPEVSRQSIDNAPLEWARVCPQIGGMKFLTSRPEVMPMPLQAVLLAGFRSEEIAMVSMQAWCPAGSFEG